MTQLGARCVATYEQVLSCCKCLFLRTAVQPAVDSQQPALSRWLTMTVTFAGETPLARRFAAAVAEASPYRARVPLAMYTAAFLAAEPSLVTSPERRRRLASAIDELVESGIIAASRALDRSAAPPL